MSAPSPPTPVPPLTLPALPEVLTTGLDALVCDLDGVITDTAGIHARSWKALFDSYLRDHARRTGIPFVPFGIDTDYIDLVDGRPRYDGVDGFLRSRGIALPWGSPDDPPDAETVCGLGNRKNTLFRSVLEEEGATVFPGAVRLLDRFKDAGGKVAVVSSSKNCTAVLKSVGLDGYFDAQVDGRIAADLGLPGKPAPDTFLEGAQRLGVPPDHAAVVEDAVAGVQAGHAGGFRLVIGIDRGAGTEALRAGGADVVVNDLGDFLP